MSLPNNNNNSTNDQSDNSELRSPEPDVQNVWSVLIAKVSGIPIRLHFTFLIMIIYFAVSGIGKGGAGTVLFVLGIFLCVVLHELGHSLTAQRFGYKVLDIVLYPIGGVASIEASPTPRHEFWVAIAGPLVNVVIAIGLGLYLHFFAGGIKPSITATAGGAFQGEWVTLLFIANCSLAVFNMIPAFPMDGGRVLRALLALKIGRVRATKIAAFIGQVAAVGIAFWGWRSQQFMLIFVALFVFFGARQEAEAEQGQEAVEGVSVGAAMVREVHTLTVGDNLRHAVELLLETNQHDFPVVHGGEVVGLLSRNALLRGLGNEGEGAYVSGSMDREVLFASADDPLEPFLTMPGGVRRAPVIVLDGEEKLVGMLTLENLMEFVTIREIVTSRADTRRA